MKYMTVLQVGDVHYPDHIGQDADLKDDTLPTTLVAETTATQLQASTRALLQRMGEHPRALLAFTGDLTSRGDIPYYQICVEYLDTAFQLGAKPPAELQAVPGNHDVNRGLADAAPFGNIYQKFAPLTQAWISRGLDVLASAVVRKSSVTVDGCTLGSYGLNSCLGCGERRALPPSLRDDLVAATSDAGAPMPAAAAAIDQVLNTSAEVLDAPAYSEEHIHDIHRSIEESSGSTLAILISHHNLLQQAQPRFDPYTDLINAGMARSRLSSLKVPVLYLHGHIHSDPIECITQLAPDSGQLVCISAPEFVSGFNQIDVVFLDDGTPVGCSVRRFRVRLHGGTVEEEPIRIRFPRTDTAISAAAARIAVVLVASPNAGSLADVERLLGNDDLLTRDEVAGALEELEWMGIVSVLNRERPITQWRITVELRHD